jgi:amino acid adenylation domain-containing protein
MDRTLHQWFEARARTSPQRIALVGTDGGVTYGDLAARSNQVAHALRRLGVGPESLVGLCVDRSVELVVGILGILKAGGAYVPVDPEYPRRRLEMLLDDCAPSVVVSVSRTVDRLPLGGARVVCIDRGDPAIADEPSDAPQDVCDESNAAYVIYTSGSTGRPKGVVVEHRNVVRLFESTRTWFDFNERDVWTLAHSFAFDFSVWEIFGALLHGGQLVIVPSEVTRSPQRFRTLLAERNVTVVNQTPSAFRLLLAEDARNAQELKLRYVVFGGEPLDVRMLEPWFARYGDEHPRVVNMYGITETTVHATYRRITAQDVGLTPGSPIGIPLPDLTIELLDESGNASPDGAAGELYVSGAGVARGYLNQPALTAERFVSAGGPARRYRSGDRAVRLPGGELNYLGRLDEQIKVRGFRIEPREVEAVLARDARVMTAIVVAHDYGDGDVRLAAYVVPNAGLDLERGAGETLAAELFELATTHLPAHMCPSSVQVVATLPITPNGKVDREALARVAGAERDGAQKAAADGVASTTEELLVAIWQEVLELTDFGCDDDFFDLGGTSLSVVRMLGRVNEHFAVALDPSALLEMATIEHVAALVDGELQARPPMEINRC